MGRLIEGDFSASRKKAAERTPTTAADADQGWSEVKVGLEMVKEGGKKLPGSVRSFWRVMRQDCYKTPYETCIILGKFVIDAARQANFERKHPELTEADTQGRYMLAVLDVAVSCDIPLGRDDLALYLLAAARYPEGPRHVDELSNVQPLV
ncbi:MAG TPA: hypothetical protein VHC21_01340 [Candidatus Saccharimonadales bacterium]|nr:hypothetical protein [Candidatus Saccharimonadales bacterium]